MSVACDYQDQMNWEHTRLLVCAFTGVKPEDVIKLPLIDVPKGKHKKVPDKTFNKFKNWQVKKS